MTNAQDDHRIGGDAIADDIGPNGDQVAPASAHRPPALGKEGKGLDRIDKLAGGPLGVERAELSYVGANSSQVGASLIRPK